MKYFVKDNERIDTCYHEFYKGKWDGETEVSIDEWIQIGQAIPQDDPSSQALYSEANEWLKDVFDEYGYKVGKISMKSI